jgi:hypothetical protein
MLENVLVKFHDTKPSIYGATLKIPGRTDASTQTQAHRSVRLQIYNDNDDVSLVMIIMLLLMMMMMYY